jgi:hypothetical protein
LRMAAPAIAKCEVVMAEWLLVVAV